ncbi:MAG: twin-arginine translocase subunit TatC [Planctomycetaceae bacterium]|nr:twin-arginine translocase subunit TatC [Planctomycetaceae bacterium]MDG1806772.1 twin-arginine translocase subunit TatC [Pirellulaceae bacterium]MDG2103811.1 twin-arginine translocase subunit TatC [Pirellulaceae bacterium]
MTQRPSDDLFEDTRMSFGDHIEELRKTLVRCLIFIGIGCIVGFMTAENVVNFLQQPLRRAIKQYNDKAALNRYTALEGFYPPEISNRIQDGLAPNTVWVDPGQLVTAIRSISPGSFEEIDLTPYRFRPSAIKPGTATETVTNAILEGADAGSDERVKAIHDLLPPDALKQLAKPEDESAAHSRLIKILNELLEDPALHDEAAFKKQFSQPSWSFSQLLNPARENQIALMKVQADLHPNDVELSRRLNRLLIASVFPKEITPPSIDLARVEIWQDITEGTQALSPHEVFMVWIKAAIIVGLTIAAPFVFYQIWMFVAAGLYPHEQKYVFYYLPLSILLFVFGVCLAFFFVFDPVLKFLFSFNASMGISPQLRIGEWLSFVMFLPLGFGIAFQLPIVMLFTNRVGLASIEFFKGNWRLAVMIISVLSMLLTPADPISMLMLGAPLTCLYFFGIALCKWMPRPETPFSEDAVDPI